MPDDARRDCSDDNRNGWDGASTMTSTAGRPRYLRISVLLGTALVAIYLLGRVYWDQYQVEAFCEDQVIIGSASDGLAESAAALGFRVRSGPTHDEGTGMILVHKESVLKTYYCDVQHIQGRVVSKSTGYF
jgi:hypothetical protein